MAFEATILRVRSACTVLATVLLTSCGGGGSNAITDGPVRFQVLTPTLIRLEYSADEVFEDRPTFTAIHRHFPAVPFTSHVADGVVEVRTDSVVIRYRQSSGPFDDENLEVELLAEGTVHHPPFDHEVGPRPGQLGGWLRSLDGVKERPAFMNAGLLDRSGVYLLDDTPSAIFVAEGNVAPRRATIGSYQDGYLFAYGTDYAQALEDLRDLTGSAPLLPRQAFGIWYSAWKPYSQSEYEQDLLPKFRSHRLPLDLLLIDTDWKVSPWAGWAWDLNLFPDPEAFAQWAAGEGLDLSLNVHPCIPYSDPQYPEVFERVGDQLFHDQFCLGDGFGATFDWGNQNVVDTYFWLHDGVHVGNARWWLDWCCDASGSSEDGVTPDAWINSLYEKDTRGRGLRPVTLSRMGGGFESYGVVEYRPTGAWADHRYGVHSTHDIGGSFEMMEVASEFTAGIGASIGVPYEAHVVGGFFGSAPPPDDLFVRWTQMATFQPLLWLHSNWKAGGGERLPWEFSDAARDASLEFLRLRHSLIPYSYSLAREAYDTGMPMVRALYLAFPEVTDAYEHESQYLYGDAILIAPVRDGGAVATTEVWLPPGRWTDWFTGQTYSGQGPIGLTTDWHRTPAFVRDGGIVVQQDYMDFDGQKPLAHLTLTIAPGSPSDFQLYEDAGEGFGFEAGEYTFTPITQRATAGRIELVIGPTEGDFPERIRARAYSVRLLDLDRAPAAVRVDAVALQGWTYDQSARTLALSVPISSTDAPVFIEVDRSRVGESSAK
jgi:alpha-glucosidase (family GH31 glycosyl hydrolase)